VPPGICVCGLGVRFGVERPGLKLRRQSEGALNAAPSGFPAPLIVWGVQVEAFRFGLVFDYCGEGLGLGFRVWMVGFGN